MQKYLTESMFIALFLKKTGNNLVSNSNCVVEWYIRKMVHRVAKYVYHILWCKKNQVYQVTYTV